MTSIPGAYNVEPAVRSSTSTTTTATEAGVDLEQPDTESSPGTFSTCTEDCPRVHIDGSSSNSFLVEATLVADHSSSENNKKNDQVVLQAKPLPRTFQWLSPRAVFVGFGLLAIIIVALSIGLINITATTKKANDDTLSEDTNATTTPTDEAFNVPLLPALQRVKDRGVLRCGTAGELTKLLIFAQSLSGSSSENVKDAQAVIQGAIEFHRNYVSAFLFPINILYIPSVRDIDVRAR